MAADRAINKHLTRSALQQAPQTKEDAGSKVMRLAVCSGNRRRVFLALNQGTKTLGTLRDELHSDSATIVHSLRELERYRLVEQDEQRDYALTVTGKALAQNVIDCLDLAHVLTSHEAFWFEHDVSGIPDYLFSRVGLLRDSTLVADAQGQILKGLRTVAALAQEAQLLEIITPFYSLEVIDRLEVFASKDKRWHIIVTEEVLQHAIKDEEHPYVKALLNGRANLRVVRHDPKLFFVSTGDAVALALSNANGQLDYSTLLTSRGSGAVTWGQELFRYYREQSERVSCS